RRDRIEDQQDGRWDHRRQRSRARHRAGRQAGRIALPHHLARRGVGQRRGGRGRGSGHRRESGTREDRGNPGAAVDASHQDPGAVEEGAERSARQHEVRHEDEERDRRQRELPRCADRDHLEDGVGRGEAVDGDHPDESGGEDPEGDRDPEEDEREQQQRDEQHDHDACPSASASTSPSRRKRGASMSATTSRPKALTGWIASQVHVGMGTSAEPGGGASPSSIAESAPVSPEANRSAASTTTQTNAMTRAIDRIAGAIREYTIPALTWPAQTYIHGRERKTMPGIMSRSTALTFHPSGAERR